MEKITALKMSQVVPDENQPRRYFNAEKLKTLKNSIKQYGIISPIIVQEMGKGKYLLIDGERRFRAATELNLKEVPALIEKPQTETDRLVRQFNIQEQHEAWTPVEKAVSITSLSQLMGLSLPATCKLLNITEGDSRKYVAFAYLVDKQAWVRNEIPLDYALGLQSLKSHATRLSKDILGKEFTKEDEKKLEHRIIALIKSGAIKMRSDLVRLKDAFVKNPKSITTFLNDSKSTPTSLFLSTKAAGAYHLRNTHMSAGYVKYHGERFMLLRDVKISPENVKNFKYAITVLESLIESAK